MDSNVLGEVDIFSPTVHLEAVATENGTREGSIRGRTEGLASGIKIGFSHGINYSMELGFYLGFIRSWKAILNKASESKSYHLIEQLENYINNLDKSHSEKKSPFDSISYIRNKFRILCAQIGFKNFSSYTSVNIVNQTQDYSF